MRRCEASLSHTPALPYTHESTETHTHAWISVRVLTKPSSPYFDASEAARSRSFLTSLRANEKSRGVWLILFDDAWTRSVKFSSTLRVGEKFAWYDSTKNPIRTAHNPLTKYGSTHIYRKNILSRLRRHNGETSMILSSLYFRYITLFVVIAEFEPVVGQLEEIARKSQRYESISEWWRQSDYSY